MLLSGTEIPLRSREPQGPERREVAMPSGRRYELEAHGDRERLVVRGTTGAVVLQIEVTDRGPVLRFESAELELVAAEGLRLKGRSIEIGADDHVSIASGGGLDVDVGGHKHERIHGDARVEAAAVEVLASSRSLRLQAMQAIALDGSHIGLNDDPCPAPFAWSALAHQQDVGDDHGG